MNGTIRQRIGARVSYASPDFSRSVFPLLLWALGCALSCVAALIFVRGWVWSSQTFYVGLIYFAGAAIAFWPSLFFSRLFIRKRSWKRTVCFAMLLVFATIIGTATVFAIQFSAYFSQWHAPVFTRLWFWQQFFTSGSAAYTYLVIGFKLYLPAGLLALFLTSWWVNRLQD